MVSRLRAQIIIAIVGLVAALAVLGPGFTIAANAQAAANTITLSPFLQNMTLLTSDTVKSYELQLTNNSVSVQNISLTTHDFGSLNSTGGILLKGSTDSYSQRYGLASWLSLQNSTVVLKPGETRQIVVSVDNSQDLQPGGHYGAIVATIQSPDGAVGNHVALNQQILSLLLVDKQGGDHYDLRLTGIQQNGNWLHLPNNIRLQFRNPGNVHVIPRGQVLLKNPVGTTIAQGIINTDSAFILPGSSRDIYVGLTSVGHALPVPGLYQIAVEYRYDGLQTVATKHYAVRFIDLTLYIITAIIMGGLIWWLKRHHQHTGFKPRKTK